MAKLLCSQRVYVCVCVSECECVLFVCACMGCMRVSLSQACRKALQVCTQRVHADATLDSAAYTQYGKATEPEMAEKRRKRVTKQQADYLISSAAAFCQHRDGGLKSFASEIVTSIKATMCGCGCVCGLPKQPAHLVSVTKYLTQPIFFYCFADSSMCPLSRVVAPLRYALRCRQIHPNCCSYCSGKLGG